MYKLGGKISVFALVLPPFLRYNILLNRKTMWNKYPESAPVQYDALGLKVSKNMLVYNKFYRTMYIASLWTISDERLWRINDSGNKVSVSHWQEITNPEA